MKKQRKQKIKETFRIGNILMKKLINANISPIGEVERIERQWHSFLSKTYKTDKKISEYFEKQFSKEINIELENYNRPICRGRDGLLYSARDMDRAMMGYS